MKLPPVIALYLQQNKSLQIEGFGRFYIDEHALYNEDADAKHSKTQSQVRFEYTPQKPTDPDFIDFVVKETGKIKPLAIADMDSYTSLARQLLNISKPFVIEGVGTLVSTTKGVLEFTPGNYEPPKINSDADKERKLRKATENYTDNGDKYNYSSVNRDDSRFNVKRMVTLLVAALVLTAIAWAVYKFVINKKSGPAQNTNQQASVTPVTGDTNTSKPAVPVAPPPPADGSTFKVVIKQINSKMEAAAFLAKFTARGHNMLMVPNNDSSQFIMKIGVTRPLSDTLRVKDSIKKYYFPKERVYVEAND